MRQAIPLLLLFTIFISCNNPSSNLTSTVDDLKAQLAQKDSLLKIYQAAQLNSFTTPATDTFEVTYASSAGDEMASITTPNASDAGKKHPSIKPSDKPKKKTPVTPSVFVKVNQDSLAIIATEDQIAWANLIWAWNDRGPCSDEWLCKTYIGNFAVFYNGSWFPFTGLVHRWFNSAHHCIEMALNNLKIDPRKTPGQDQGDDKLVAIAWVMATQIHNAGVYEWDRTHGDAVLRALYRLRSEVDWPSS